MAKRSKVDLVCSACKHAFQVVADNLLKNEGKHCPECGSESVRQTFASYLRNGPLLDPRWGCSGEGRPYG